MIDHRPKMVNDGGSTYSASTRIQTNKTVYEESSAYQKALEDLKNAESRPSAVESVLGINPQTGALSAGGAGGKLRANDLLPDAAPAAQAAGGVETDGVEVGGLLSTSTTHYNAGSTPVQSISSDSAHKKAGISS